MKTKKYTTDTVLLQKTIPLNILDDVTNYIEEKSEPYLAPKTKTRLLHEKRNEKLKKC